MPSPPTTPSFRPSPLPTPVDHVRFQILNAVESGELHPGDRLPSEVEAARGFNVSRSAVREALKSLAHLGLITTVPGRGGGSFVNRLDHEPVERGLTEAMQLLLRFDGINVAEIADARRALEGACAELAARRRSEADVAAMAQILTAVEDDGLSDEDWLDLDIHFHRRVVQSAYNRVLQVPLATLHRLAQPRLNEMIRPLLDRHEINAQHRAIADAIGSRDPAAARAAVNRHVEYLEGLYGQVGLLPDGSLDERANGKSPEALGKGQPLQRDNR